MVEDSSSNCETDMELYLGKGPTKVERDIATVVAQM